MAYTNYSVIRTLGDKRYMFYSMAHESCLRSRKLASNDRVRRELADDLRAKVANEFIKRRKEIKWFIFGDFDIYVSEIQKLHVGGGEPKLLMALHVF
ncbi:hypothetical protein PTKIN_Ptkin09bG0157400 [Pterospermum kingtungense]